LTFLWARFRCAFQSITAPEGRAWDPGRIQPRDSTEGITRVEDSARHPCRRGRSRDYRRPPLPPRLRPAMAHATAWGQTRTLHEGRQPCAANRARAQLCVALLQAPPAGPVASCFSADLSDPGTARQATTTHRVIRLAVRLVAEGTALPVPGGPPGTSGARPTAFFVPFSHFYRTGSRRRGEKKPTAQGEARPHLGLGPGLTSFRLLGGPMSCNDGPFCVLSGRRWPVNQTAPCLL